MKAIILEQFGGPEGFIEKEIPEPKVSRNQVRVKIEAVGFNPVDVKMRRGVYGDPLPALLGVDFSGIVDAVGDPRGEFEVGDRVFGLTQGAYAQSVVVPSQHIAKIPKNLSFQEAAVIPVVYLTAFQAMIGSGALQQERPFFIAGGSGGVGSAAIHLAKAYRAGPIFTLAGRQNSRDYLIEELKIPSGQILNYSGLKLEQIAAKLIEMNGGSRFYFAFDCVGGESKKLCLELADINGHVSSILPEDPSFSCQLWGRESIFWKKSLSMQLVYLFSSFSSEGSSVYKSQLHHLVKLFEKGELPPPKVHNVGPFSAESVQKAHRLIEEGQTVGKLAMTLSDSK